MPAPFVLHSCCCLLLWPTTAFADLPLCLSVSLQAVASALLPKLEKTRREVEEVLFEVVTLEVGAGWRCVLGWWEGACA